MVNLYGEGDEVTIKLGKAGAELLNASQGFMVYSHTIHSRKPKADLLDEADEHLGVATQKSVRLLIQYLREQRGAK